MKRSLFYAIGILTLLSGSIQAATDEKENAVASVEPEKTLRWAGCGITKKAFMKELALAYEKYFGVHFELEGGGATKGIRQVSNRTVDIGGSCRHKIKSSKEERSVQLVPVAWDALVVMVHPDNPVTNITLKELKSIYEGKVTNWKQLGGNDAPIELLARSSKISGVGMTLRELVWADADKDFASKVNYPSSGPLEKAIEQNPNAIGVSGISSARKRSVNLLTLEGKAPTYDHIKNGEYQLYRPLYITYATRQNPNLKEIKRFVTFAHSKVGRQIIRDQGVVPYIDGIALVNKQKEQWEAARKIKTDG